MTRPAWTSALVRFRSGDASGFSLIEALVALAVIGVSLSAIGEVFGSNLQTARRLEDRLTLEGEGELIMTALPDRARIAPGVFTGSVDGDPWRMVITPLTAGDAGKAPTWRPVAIVLTLRTPAGQSLRLDTIRLSRPAASGG